MKLDEVHSILLEMRKAQEKNNTVMGAIAILILLLIIAVLIGGL